MRNAQVIGARYESNPARADDKGIKIILTILSGSATIDYPIYLDFAQSYDQYELEKQVADSYNVYKVIDQDPSASAVSERDIKEGVMQLNRAIYSITNVHQEENKQDFIRFISSPQAEGYRRFEGLALGALFSSDAMTANIGQLQ